MDGEWDLKRWKPTVEHVTRWDMAGKPTDEAWKLPSVDCLVVTNGTLIDSQNRRKRMQSCYERRW